MSSSPKEPEVCSEFVVGIIEGAKVRSIYKDRHVAPEPIICTRCTDKNSEETPA